MPDHFFINDDFLLETEQARQLYHRYAENLPIIDFHCHLAPREIAEDRRWQNISEAWLAGDHYKWRAMRANGVDEQYCTGKSSDRDKFDAWARTMPWLLRNPMYHWTHLELARCFGITDRLLNPDNADGIWKDCNANLAEPAFSARGIMKQFHVELVCTTDDPVDSLQYHKAIAADPSFHIAVLPTWRPDKGMAVEEPAAFNAWLDRLERAADIAISDFDSYIAALRKRHDFFAGAGCRLSDHGLETVYSADYTEPEIKSAFAELRAGKALSPDPALKFKSAMLHEFSVMDHEQGWVQQFHLGVLRNLNSVMFGRLGPDAGFDAIGDREIASCLARFLDRLNCRGNLTKTIIYNINPRDNATIAALLGCFQDGVIPGKMQFGSAWWFLDQKDGIERQIEVLSQFGLLRRFVGMVTDSRSFLSYPRHEYFRRILCNILGNDMARGLIPNDIELAGSLVRDVCHDNAAAYFGFRK